MSDQNWRTEINAEDYFSHQKKAANLADRRPVIRNAGDLVGPGIGPAAITITDFNDILATYNGFFSAVAGAASAPSNTEPFVGGTAMDSTLGGVQTFTGLTSGKRYHRLFTRNPSDAETIYWGDWTDESLAGCPIGFEGTWPGAGAVPAGWLEELGQSLSITTYAVLFAVIGYTYGGSGASFNLPDMRDRTAYGVGAEWSLGTTDGLSYGSRERILIHQHGVTSVADHSHSIPMEAAHTHGIAPASLSTADNTDTGGSAHRLTSGESHDHLGSTGAGGFHNHGGSTGSAGSHNHGGFTANPATNASVTLPGVGKRWIIRYI